MSSLTPINEAFDTLLSTLASIDESESVPLLESTGRVLATDIVSNVDVPPLTNSAMDGYAVRSADLNNEPNGEFATLKLRNELPRVKSVVFWPRVKLRGFLRELQFP